MATKIERQKRPEDFETSRVRISVDSLIHILSNEASFQKFEISAETYDHSFEDLEDMKENRNLLAGSPTVTVGDFRIIFGNDRLKIARNYNADTPEHDVWLDNVSKIFVRYRDPIRLFDGMGSYCFSLFFFSLLMIWAGPNESLKYLVTAMLILAGLCFIAFATSKTYLKISDSVYYGPEEGLLKRNFDKIAVGTIMVIITLLGREIWDAF